jgi:N6-adenosine-specific RNA methylase IME4
MLPLPAQEYDVVLADPPWPYFGAQDKWGAAAKFYNTMSAGELADLPIADWLTPRGVLFMWATGPKMDLALSCIHLWGLTYRGIAFVWVKTKKDGKPVGAQGVRPSIVKPTTELVVVASKVIQGRPMPLASESVRQVVFAPKGDHSAKPDTVHRRIEALYPQASKAELFARRHMKGWDCFGDQLPRSRPAEIG